MTIRLARPYLGNEEFEAARDVLESGWLVQGPRVADFETAVSEYTRTAACVACSSGTAALHLAMLALDLQEGDEVLVPDYTFPATANVILHTPARPVLVDVDPKTFNMDLSSAERALSPRTRAVLVVHQFGLPVSPELVAFCGAHGLTLVEDAACALGAEVQLPEGWTQSGAVGLMGCFSLHPRKVITTGEGGLVTTDSQPMAERLRLLRNHGMERTPQGTTFALAGLNYRLTEMQGAIGSLQMGRLPDILADRRRIAAGYDELLASLPLQLPARPADRRPIFQSYVVLLPEGSNRDAVLGHLRSAGVECTVGAHALHRQPHLAGLRRAPQGLAGSTKATDLSVSLPVPWALSEDDIEQVGMAMAKALEQAG